MKIIYSFTNIAPHYRSNLWHKLASSKEFDFYFFYGYNKKLKIKEVDFESFNFLPLKGKFSKLKNFWIKGSILIWQKGVVKKCLSDEIDVVIFLGEFQVLSTWLAMLVCKLRGIKVVYWSHGLYGNESIVKSLLRVLFYKTADELLLYEKRAKKLLIKKGLSGDKMKVIYNSLDYDFHLSIRNKLVNVQKEIIFPFFEKPNLNTLLFIGRLTKIKKINLLIETLKRLNRDKDLFNLLIVGDGSEKFELINLSKKLKLQNYVHFYGSCHDEKILSKLIFNSDLCVSPGNVGLTAIHSLSYGLPVCSHDNFYKQMPEIEAIKNWYNGILFEENNLDDLVLKIEDWFKKRDDKFTVNNRCYEVIDKYYNPNYQLEIINSL